MQLLNYFLSSVVAFLGLLAGIILIKIAPEEKKTLSKYFKGFKHFLAMLSFIFLLAFYYKSIPYGGLIILLALFYFLVESRTKSLIRKSILQSCIIGIVFFLGSINLGLFVIESSLIFIYGLPISSLAFEIKNKNYAEIFLHNGAFLVASNALFCLPFLVSYL